jgi:hypothetical protein
MNLIENKKGQGMSTNTIILLILGVVVLVVLILGFTTGWQKILPFVDSSNVDDISKSCSAACAIQSKYDYCSSPRVLKDGEGNEVKTSCAVLAGLDEFSKYGIESCGEIDCSLNCKDIKIGDQAGNKDLTQGTYNLSSLAVEGNCYIE